MLKERIGHNGKRVREESTGQPRGILGNEIIMGAEGHEEGR